MNIQLFDFSVNLIQALLWQYDDATTLQSLITSKQNWYTQNQTDFWTSWITDVFNLQTANDFGLAVWSIILGLPLFIAVHPDPDDKPIFGFDDLSYQNFDNGTFANPTGSYVLTTAQKRIMLQLRYFQLITRGAIPEINAFLAFVFGPGQVYAMDGLDMSMVYVFTSYIDPNLFAAIVQYDILARPAGVRIRYIDGTRMTFGFDDPSFQNFDNGTFLDG